MYTPVWLSAMGILSIRVLPLGVLDILNQDEIVATDEPFNLFPTEATPRFIKSPVPSYVVPLPNFPAVAATSPFHVPLLAFPEESTDGVAVSSIFQYPTKPSDKLSFGL